MSLKIKKIIIIFFAVFITLNSCKRNAKPLVPDLRFVMVSEPCNQVIYSINSDNLYRPWVISNAFSGKPAIRPFILPKNMELFFQTESCDCNTVALYDFDKDQQNRKSTYFYFIADHKLINISQKYHIKITESSFSPVDSIYAYLDDSSKLQMLNYKTDKFIQVRNPDNVKFHYITWSTKGHYIYLEDDSSSLWKYYKDLGRFKLLWKSPRKSEYSKELTLSKDNEDEFYFRSDHESNFTQLYKYSPSSGAKLLFTSNDQKSLYIPVKNDSLLFKSFTNDLLVLKLFYKGKLISLSPQTGVLYDYHPGKYPIIVYSDNKHPYSVYKMAGDTLVNLIKGINDTMPNPKIVRNNYGMNNLIYFPNDHAKKWVVLLHGGPHQEVFNKYDRYIAYLLSSNIGVINLNYPGSAGTGRKYEMRNNPELKSIELKSIADDLAQIKNQYKMIGSFMMLGVSYSAQISHLYSLTHSDVTGLIDLSGYGAMPIRKDIPILYIYGKNDFALDNKERIQMIQAGVDKGNAKTCVVDDEGHVIARKNNTLKVLQNIVDFINSN